MRFGGVRGFTTGFGISVSYSLPEVERWRDRTPVLVDDIISTGRTMIETIGHLRRAGMRPPVCVCVHGIIADGADDGLAAAGAARIVTANTVPHPSNTIDVTGLLATAVDDMLDRSAAET